MDSDDRAFADLHQIAQRQLGTGNFQRDLDRDVTEEVQIAWRRFWYGFVQPDRIALLVEQVIQIIQPHQVVIQ